MSLDKKQLAKLPLVILLATFILFYSQDYLPLSESLSWVVLFVVAFVVLVVCPVVAFLIARGYKQESLRRKRELEKEIADPSSYEN